MAWGKAGSTTLSSGSDTITVSDITASKINQTLSHVIQTTSNIRMATRVGNGSIDTGSNYANRSSENGASEATATSQTYHKNSGSVPSDMFAINYAVNIATEEKLFISHNVVRSTAGAGTAPQRMESVGKWANTSDQFNYIETVNDQAGDYTTDSNLSVIGSDITPAAAVPAIDNVQDNSLFVEKENAKRYWFSAERDNTLSYENTSAVSLGAGDSGTSIDLTGSTLDDSWVLRFKVTMTSLGTGSSLLFMVQNSTTTTVSTARDGIGLRQTDSSNFYDFEGCDNVAGNAGQYDHRFTTTPATDTKYVQITRTSATSAKIEFYDSTYTTVSESSGDITIANITGLRYFVITNNGSALTVDDIDFWNGVTSATIPATWLLGKSYVSKSDCLAYYNFEQTSGNLINQATTANGFTDGLGSSADLSPSNVIYSQTGKVGTYSWGFNGSNTHAQGANLGSIPTKFTFAVWFKQDTLSNYQGLFSTHDPNSYGTNNIGVRVESNISGSLSVLIGNDSNGGATYTSKNAGTISAGQWYFLVIKGDTSANTVDITLNDTTNNYTGLSGYWSTTFPDLCIGTGYNTSRRFDGLVDDFSYWDRHLTSDEISSLYNSGHGVAI